MDYAGDLGGGGYTSAINDNDQVVGESYVSGGGWHAFLWSNGQTVDLGGQLSYANGINDLGEIVGSSMDDNGDLEPVTWNGPTHSPNYLTPGIGGTAYGVNEAGDVVGWSAQTGATFFCGGSTGGSSTAAYIYSAVNGSGQAVGTLNYSYVSDGTMVSRAIFLGRLDG